MDGMRKRIEGFQPGRIYGSSQAGGDGSKPQSNEATSVAASTN